MPCRRRSSIVLALAAILFAGCAAASGSPSTSGMVSPAASPSGAASAASAQPASPSPTIPTPLPSSVALPTDALIAYTSGVPGDTSSIAVILPDGSAASRLAAGRDPTWTPDGRDVVFTCPAEGNADGFPAICSMPSGEAGAEPRLVVGRGDRPSVSPDGTLLAYHQGMIDVGETWLATAGGLGAHLLTAGALLAWSPGGSWLAGQSEAAAAELAVIRSNGTRYQVLTPGYDPAWSPNGDRFAYGLVTEFGSSLRSLDLTTGLISGIYVGGTGAELGAPAWLDTDTVVFVMAGDLWRLGAHALLPIRLTAGLGISGRLSLSPDRAWIVASTERVDGAQVTPRLVIASAAGGWRVLDTGDEPASQPAWQPQTDR